MLSLSLTPCNQLLTGFQTNALRTSRNGFRSTGTLCEQSLQETIRRLECLSTAEIQVLAHKSVKQLNKVLNADISKAPCLEENLGLVYNALQSNKGYFQSKLFSTKPSPFLVSTRGFKTKRSDPATDKPFTTLNSKDENKKNEALNDILKQIEMPPREKEKLNIAVHSYAAGLKQGSEGSEGDKSGAKGDEKKKWFEWSMLHKLATVLFVVSITLSLSQFFNVKFSVINGKANEIAPEDIEVTFDDVKGCDEAKEELMEIVEFLVNPEKFSNLGGRLPKGCLLVGPPGTGKTLLARAVAGEAGVPFFHASGSEFDEVLVGQGARRVRDLFKAAKNRAPCVLFIDEIDSVGSKRTSSSLHPYANQTINQLLSEMDGFMSNEGVIVLGATNRAQDLDKALLRPGRFDTQVTVDNPDIKGRRDILVLYLAKIKHDDGVDIEKLAKMTIGFSGADLQNMVNTAAIRAAVDGKDSVSMAEFEYSHDKHVMGTDWKSRVRNRVDLKITAYHEAGHVLVAYFTQDADPLHKVTIVAKGQSGGHTAFFPEEKGHMTKAQYHARMDVGMGGRAAEELIFGKENITGGASGDLRNATGIAGTMVKTLGMSEKIGLRVVQDDEMAPGSTELMDIEITRLLNESYKRATNILIKHRRELELLAEALLQYETLDSEDIKCIIDNKRPPPPRPTASTINKGLTSPPRIQITDKLGLPVVQGPEALS